MAQSSIEYFWQQVARILPVGVDSPVAIKLYDTLKQAKEMHKQESIAAQMDMFHHLNNLPFGMQYLDKRESAEQFSEQYYNETFGGDNERD